VNSGAVVIISFRFYVLVGTTCVSKVVSYLANTLWGKHGEQVRITANRQLLDNVSVSQPFNQTDSQSTSQWVEKCTTIRAVSRSNQPSSKSMSPADSHWISAKQSTRSVRQSWGKYGCRCVTSGSALLSSVGGSTNYTKIVKFVNNLSCPHLITLDHLLTHRLPNVTDFCRSNARPKKELTGGCVSWTN
jgi:hypothetical protein